MTDNDLICNFYGIISDYQSAIYAQYGAEKEAILKSREFSKEDKAKQIEFARQISIYLTKFLDDCGEHFTNK